MYDHIWMRMPSPLSIHYSVTQLAPHPSYLVVKHLQREHVAPPGVQGRPAGRLPDVLQIDHLRRATGPEIDLSLLTSFHSCNHKANRCHTPTLLSKQGINANQTVSQLASSPRLSLPWLRDPDDATEGGGGAEGCEHGWNRIERGDYAVA